MIYYCFDKDSERSAAREHANAHALLRLALGEQGVGGYELKRRAGGKPYIEGCPLCFSLTHTDGFCAVAVSAAEVGIDAERTQRRLSERMLKRICTAEELERCRTQEELIRLWTLKEAAAKLSGRGIAQMLEGIAFDMDTLYSEDAGCYGTIFVLGGVTVAVCEEKKASHELVEIDRSRLERFL